jgi:hypothetical protein
VNSPAHQVLQEVYGYDAFRGQQETARAVRLTMMATEVLWAIHNILVWSPVAVTMEVLFFT